MQNEIYTKKVLDLFKKPHNYGKIKNPDGVGKVGNLTCGDVMWLYIKIGKNDVIKDIKFETFGCFPPSEKVLVNEGDWKEISQIKKGEEVLNHRGNKAEVLETFERQYNGLILTITPFVSRFNRFSVTPEHPILCVKRRWLDHARKYSKSNKCKWLKINREELLKTKPRFILANDIEEGDYLLFSVSRKIKDASFFTKDLMGLIGYYLSEGYVSANNSVVAFGLNKKEKENIEELKNLLFKVTGKQPKERDRRTAKEIYVCSRKWVKILITAAGKLATKKRLSREILLLPLDKQWEMMRTYIKGDGNVYKRRPENSSTYRMATASENLAIQIQEILARNNIFSSIKKYDNSQSRNIIEGRKVFPNPIYEISYRLERIHNFFYSNGKHFLIPIRSIEKKTYTGHVYNIQVNSNPPSYLIKGFAVHNCVAAISTSSIITDLAKGKTIEKALKITKENVVSSLGGLPKLKWHCSVLAVDALVEAIYDHLTKNKKPISDELKQRHQRIKKEKKIIEKRYKKWVK